MRFASHAVSIFVAIIPSVASFVPRIYLNRNSRSISASPVSFESSPQRQRTRILEKPRDEDSAIMDEVNGDVNIDDDADALQEATDEVSQETGEESKVDSDEEKDEQTLFDEANMRKAIQLVVAR